MWSKKSEGVEVLENLSTYAEGGSRRAVGQAEREQRKPGKMSVMEEKTMTKLSRAERTEKTRTESIP